MKPLRIPLRVVFYREDNLWVAHCLEMDLMGHGESKQEALEVLNEAIIIQVKASIDFSNAENLISPADGKYFRMFAEGKDVAVGQVSLSQDSVTIGNVEARVYADEDAALV